MKRVIFTIAMCLCVAMSYAQAPKRQTVVLDYFSKSSNVSTAARDMIRDAVFSGFTNSGRLNIIDATNTKALKISESAAKKSNAPSADNIRQNTMKESGAKYLVTGNVSMVDAVEEQGKDEKIFYNGVVSFSLVIIDLETGHNMLVEEISCNGFKTKSETKEVAISEVVRHLHATINRFVNDNFKLETKVVQIHEEKGGKVTKVYINVGSALGVGKNQTFMMYIDSDVAGVKKREEIGRLTVDSVFGDELTLCKVSKPSEEIKAYMNNGSGIIVITDKQKVSASEFKGVSSSLK